MGLHQQDMNDTGVYITDASYPTQKLQMTVLPSVKYMKYLQSILLDKVLLSLQDIHSEKQFYVILQSTQPFKGPICHFSFYCWDQAYLHCFEELNQEQNQTQCISGVNIKPFVYMQYGILIFHTGRWFISQHG